MSATGRRRRMQQAKERAKMRKKTLSTGDGKVKL